MATTELDTAETVPLTPLQKIEVDDKELRTSEYEESSNQLSKDELKKIEIEITKALETTKQIGDGDTDTPPVHNDAEVRSLDVGAQDNVGVSEGRVLEKVPADPEVSEERNSTETQVHTVTEENDELLENGKPDEPEESSSVDNKVEKIDEGEKHVPSVDNVAKVEAEDPPESQWVEQVPGEAAQTPSEYVELSDQLSDLESHKEGETQPGANKISYDNVKAISSGPVKEIEGAVVADAKEEHEKPLVSEVREKVTSEDQAKLSKEPESVPNALYEENLEVAERSEEPQEKKESISDDLSTPQKDADDSERGKYVEVIVDEFENKESTTDADTLHEEGVEKQVPQKLIQPAESLHVHAKELETKEKETDSIQEEHVVKDTSKLEEKPEQAISSKDDPGAKKLESSLDIIPEKQEDAEPSESAVKIIPDAEEEKTINEQHSEEADTESKDHETTKETDTTQLDTEETENKDVENPSVKGSSSFIEETRSAESKKIDDNDISVLKTEDERDGVSQTEIAEEKTARSLDVVVETGNLQHVVPRETDTEDLVKHAAMEVADAVQVTEESPEAEGLHSKVDSNEADSPPVSSFNSEANKEKSKEEPSTTSLVEQILQDEKKSEEREHIIEELNDGPISTSIDDTITEQINIVGHNENIFTESHDKDVTAVPLDHENEASNKKEISEQFISETEDEPEMIVSQTNKPDVELPESSLNSSTQKPEEVSASDEIAGIRIATTEKLADKTDEQGTYIAECKVNYTESARKMNSALTETKENTGEAETDILNHNAADVKEILPTDQIPEETKGVVSDDAGISILPEKDEVSATSKPVDSTPEENIEEKEERGKLTPEKLVEPEKPHDTDSSQISKDGDAETTEGENIEIYEKEDAYTLTVTGDDSSSELQLPEESDQKETSKDEKDDAKPAAIDETTETVEQLQVETPAETEEHAPGNDEDTSASLNMQAPVEKAEYLSETDKIDPTGECDIQGLSEELPVESRGDTAVDVSEADKIVDESVEEDATKPEALSVSITGVQTHGTDVPTQAEQTVESASLVENKVETSQEAVSEPDPDKSENLEIVTKTGPGDSEKLNSEPDPDDSENLEKVSQGDLSEIENLKRVSEPDPDDKDNLEQVSEPSPDDKENLEEVSVPDDSENQTQFSEQDLDETDTLKQVSEQGPDDQKILKQDDSEHLKETSEPDPDESEKLSQISEPDPDDSEIVKQASEPDPVDSEKLKKDSEPDPDDTETLKLSEPAQNLKNASEPEPTDSENQENVGIKDTPEDSDDVLITEHPKDGTVEILEKTYEQAGETTVSDEVSSVSAVEETVPRSIEVVTATDAAPELSVENSVHEEDSKYQIPELKAKEISEPTTSTPEQTIESATEHVEESGSEETVNGIQHNDAEEEKKTSEASGKHIIKELESAEGFSPPVDSKPDEVEEIKEEKGIANAAADKDESEIPVTVIEGDRTLVPEVKDQKGEEEADKEVILQENEPGLLPKEAEEPGPSASSLNDNSNLESKEAPEEALQQEKDGQEEAGCIVEKINVSEVVALPHDNLGEEPEHFPGDAELSTPIVNDEKITSLTSEEEKEEKQDDIEREVVIQEEEENDQQKSDNVEEKRIAPKVVVLEDAQAQTDKLLHESEVYEKFPSSSNDEDAKITEGPKDPEEFEEKILVENQSEDDDTVTDIKTAKDAVVQQEEQKEEMIHLPNETEETVQDEHISYQIREHGSEEKSEPSETTQEPVTKTETEHREEKVSVTQPNDAKEENQTSEASEKHIIVEEEEGVEGQSSPADALVDERKPDEANKDIHKQETIENVAADTNKVEPEIPLLMVERNQIFVQEVKEGQGEGETLKEEEVKEAILQENEPEHLPEASASSANDVGIIHLVSKDVPEEVLQKENDKDGLEDAGSVTEKINLSEELGQPHESSAEETEHMSRKTEDTELDASTINNENNTSMKTLEDKEGTQNEVEPEVVTEDRKDKTDDIVEEKQTTDEVILPVDEQVQLDQLLNKPEGIEPSATGLNDNDVIEREKGPEEVQEQSVERQPGDADNVTESIIAEQAVVQKDEQGEEIIHLNNEADDTEIPSDNVTALKDEEEKANRQEKEYEQDQAKENETVDEIESASEVIIHEDQQRVQLKHLESEEEEAMPPTIHEEVVQENTALKIEYLQSDSVEAEPIGEDETVLDCEEEPEGILHDEKKANHLNIDTVEIENANEELKQEDDQGQLMHVSDGTENLDPPVSYTSEEKQTSLESKEVLDEDLVEKSKNDHTEVDVQEKKTVNNEFVLPEPSASLGNDDEITTLKSDENPKDIQEEKETKQAEDVGDTKLSESVNAAALIPEKEIDLANTKVEADSSVENARAYDAVPRGQEDPERVEEDEQEKDQVIDEKVTATEISVEVDSKGDELEQCPILNEDAEPYASNASDDNFTTVNRGENTAEETREHTQESGDDIRQKDPSNEDVKSAIEELNARSIENKNNLESKEPESVEDDVKKNSIIEDSINLGNMEDTVETSHLETEIIKSVDEEAATADETTIINELHESIVEKDVDEVLKVSAALPPADDKFDHALESLKSVEVTDSEAQRDFVETAKETEEEKLESIIPIAGKEDEKDLINMETHQEKLPQVLGEENRYANDFVTTNIDEKNLQTLKTFKVPTLAVEDDQVNAPEIPGKHEAGTLNDEEQKKLISSETFKDETTEKITENQTYVEAETSAGSNAEELEEISSSVLDKGDEIQKEDEGDENIQTIKEKESLALEDVTLATSDAAVTIKEPDESTTESEGTIEQQITKDTKESSVNEGQNLEPLSSGRSKPEDLGIREAAEIMEVPQMQEALLVTTQLKDELNKHQGEEKYIEVTHKEEKEDENDTGGHDDSSNEIVTELAKLQEPDTIVAPVGDERTGEVTSIELVKEETKGETETEVEPLCSILEEVGANEAQVQEKITASPSDDKSEGVSQEVAEETKVSPEFPQVSTRNVYAGEGKQINESQAGELLDNKVEPIKETEAVKVEREIKDEAIQDLNSKDTKGYKLDELDLDESSTKDAAIKVNLTDRDSTQLTAIPSERVEPSGIPLKIPIAKILEKQEGEEATVNNKPSECKSTEDVIEGASSKDSIAISEKKDDTKPSSEIDIPSTTREPAAPQNKISTIKTEGSDTSLPIQQLTQSKTEAGLRESTHADKNLRDSSRLVSTENSDVPTEILQSTSRSLDFSEVVQPESAKKTESQSPLKIPEESSLSELLQISTKDTIQMTQQPNQETNPTTKKEDLQPEDPKTDEDKDDEEDEEGEEHKKTDSSSDGVIVEASRDMEVKSPQKKHHGILSGVGTKVKNSISKVKKAITGKSSHPKPPSPK